MESLAALRPWFGCFPSKSEYLRRTKWINRISFHDSFSSWSIILSKHFPIESFWKVVYCWLRGEACKLLSPPVKISLMPKLKQFEFCNQIVIAMEISWSSNTQPVFTLEIVGKVDFSIRVFQSVQLKYIFFWWAIRKDTKLPCWIRLKVSGLASMLFRSF